MWYGQEKGLVGALQAFDSSAVGRKDKVRFSCGGTILIVLALLLFVSGCATDTGSTASRSTGVERPAIHYRKIEPMGNPGIWVDGRVPE